MEITEIQSGAVTAVSIKGRVDSTTALLNTLALEQGVLPL